MITIDDEQINRIRECLSEEIRQEMNAKFDRKLADNDHEWNQILAAASGCCLVFGIIIGVVLMLFWFG